jgi:hypothetical protein
MFDNILEALETNGRGSHGYRKAFEIAITCIKSDPNQAAGYLLLMVQAERFIENTGRLAVTSVQTDRAYNDFAENVAWLKSAYATKDPSAVVSALNAISAKMLEPLDPSFTAQ